MNYRLTALLSLVFGLILGFGAMADWWHLRGLGYLVAVLAVIISSVYLAHNGKASFISGFVTGCLIGIVQFSIELIFWDIYTINHPGLLEKYPMDLYSDYSALRMHYLSYIPVYSTIYGVIIGMFSWLVSRINSSKRVKSIVE